MKTLFVIPLLFFAALLVSCGPKTEVITNTYSTAEPGNVKGTVKLFDTNGVAISDASGVTVSMEGTKYSTLTATDGTWELANVPAGTYPSLMYSKAGFPTFKSYQGYQGAGGSIGAYIVGGGGTQYDGIQTFYQINYISVDLVIRGFQDYKQVIPRDTVINKQQRTVYDTVVVPLGQATFTSRILDAVSFSNFYGVLYLGVSPNIDPTNPASFLYESSTYDGSPNPNYISQASTTGTANFNINKLLLKTFGFVSGQTIYCSAYFGNYNSVYNNDYNDPSTGMIIFPGFSPHHSEVKSFILP